LINPILFPKDNIYWRHEEIAIENDNDKDEVLLEEVIVDDEDDVVQIERERPKGFEDLEV
jgi:hypothetical protein